MLKLARLLSVAVFATFVLGCATTTNSPRQGVAACYSSVAVAFNSAADVKARGQLSKEQEGKVLQIGDEALKACDAARVALAAGDVSTTEGKLRVAEAALLTLEAYLKGAK